MPKLFYLRTTVTVACCAASLLHAQTKDGEWRSYGGDVGNTRYSPLKQIDASNFNKLQVAWRFSGASFGATAGVQPGGDAFDGEGRGVSR